MAGFMVPFGIGIALAVRLGATLPLSVERARTLTIGTFGMSFVLFGAMGGMMYWFQNSIFGVFTTETAVLDLAHEIWPKVCVYYFNLCVYALNMGLATGLGQQWFFGIVTAAFLWGISLPGMYYFCIIQKGGLSTAWACITQPYIIMNIFLIHRFFCKQDWNEIQHSIRMREGMEDSDDDDDAAILARYENGAFENNLESTTANETTGLLLLQKGQKR
jgi:Na+-driven multidrug efflux pump